MFMFDANNDEEFRILRSLGYTGTLNDMQEKYLKSLNYNSFLSDMASEYLNTPNVVTNGDFRQGNTDWILAAAGWVFENDAMVADGTQPNFTTVLQAVLDTSKNYRSIIRVSNITDGWVRVLVSTSNISSLYSADGVYVYDAPSNPGNANLQIQASKNFVGQVDEIKVFEVSRLKYSKFKDQSIRSLKIKS